jgi:hypothetical protein
MASTPERNIMIESRRSIAIVRVLVRIAGIALQPITGNSGCPCGILSHLHHSSATAAVDLQLDEDLGYCRWFLVFRNACIGIMEHVH